MPRHEPADWAMLLALTALWGSAFLLTKVAVAGIPPGWVVVGRLALAAALLLPLAAWRGDLGPIDPRGWIFMALIALLGNVLPFWLIAWGQRGIDSGLSGILMAVMPLAVLGLAHVFVPGEGLTSRRLVGFALGFAGVAVLLGPETLGDQFPDETTGSDAGGGPGALPAMLAVLGGALCYAVSSILARLRPAQGALPTAALVTLMAALMALPIALAVEPPPPRAPVWSEVAALLGLGAFSTAIAAVVYFRLIASAGPSFTALLNYMIPVWAVALGVLLLGESPQPHHLYGLALILLGVLIAATRGGRQGPGREQVRAGPRDRR
jgi:drug/metabolite transporter (DMT)-like permease